LAIIGTERHESRRIDNQLRGRAGRQGDPGSSQFFVSLDDEIMRIFGGDQIAKVMNFLQIEEDQAIENSMVSKAIESAQTKVESFFFDQRKRLVDFDDVMNKHREIIYTRRRNLLETAKQIEEADQAGLKQQILDYLSQEVRSIILRRFSDLWSAEDANLLINDLIKIIPFDEASQKRLEKKIFALANFEQIETELLEIVKKTYDLREEKLGSDLMRELEKYVVLSSVDEQWMDHLDMMEDLRQGIWLRGDKNTVLSEYKRESFNMFEALIERIQSMITERVFRVQPLMQNPSPLLQNINLETTSNQGANLAQALASDPSLQSGQSSPATAVNRQAKAGRQAGSNNQDLAGALGALRGRTVASAHSGSTTNTASLLTEKKVDIGRNDLCPCGSGLKYKKCGLLGKCVENGGQI